MAAARNNTGRETLSRADLKDAIKDSQELVVEKIGRVGDAVDALASTTKEAEARFAREVMRLDAVDQGLHARADLIESKAETAALQAQSITTKLRTFSAVSAGVGTIIGAIASWLAHVIGVFK